jgi:hypothetical protein
MIEMMLKKRTRILLLVGFVAALFAFLASPASADMAAAKKWVDKECGQALQGYAYQGCLRDHPNP